MEPKDLIVRILEQIRDDGRVTRDEIRTTRIELCERIDQTNVRIDRLDARIERMDARLAGVEHVMIGIATKHASLERHVDDRLHLDLAELRRRIEALESKAG